jgi:hypothetical protein
MRTLNDPSGICGPLVSRMIGPTAYETVKAVADRLDEIGLLAPNADAIAALAEARTQLLLLVPEIPELLVIADNVDALINGTKPASTILYGSQTLQQVLDNLLYQGIQIQSFQATPNIAEMGSAVASVVLNWALSRSGTSQKINGTAIDPNLRTITSNVPIGADSNYVLHIDDAGRSVEAAASVLFKRKRYWGVSANANLTDADIRAMSSEFADNRQKTVVFNASGGNYPIFAYPAAFGTPTLKVQGSAFSDFAVTPRSFTNASNYASDYNVVRFNGLQTGSAIEVIFA